MKKDDQRRPGTKKIGSILVPRSFENDDNLSFRCLVKSNRPKIGFYESVWYSGCPRNPPHEPYRNHERLGKTSKKQTNTCFSELWALEVRRGRAQRRVLSGGLCPRTPVVVGLWASPGLRLMIAGGKYLYIFLL